MVKKLPPQPVKETACLKGMIAEQRKKDLESAETRRSARVAEKNRL